MKKVFIIFPIVAAIVIAIYFMGFSGKVYGQSASPAPSAPSVQFSVFNISPSAITLGQSATVTWATINASNCTTSAWWPPGVTNYAATSGSQVVTPTSAGTYTYAMQCAGIGDVKAASQSITLTVNSAAGSPNPIAPPVTGGSISNNSAGLVPVYQPPTGATLTLGTSKGSVAMKNFYNTALGADGEFVVIAQNNNYEINYDTYNSGFDLDIEQAPFSANRAAAEANFLSLIGASQADACKLAVSVSAESAANSGYGLSARLPLSFCASSAVVQ